MSYTWTREQIASLSQKTYVESITEKGGLYFEKEFMDQMYKVWSEKRKLYVLKDFLLTNDFGQENICQSDFLLALWDQFKGILIRTNFKLSGTC